MILCIGGMGRSPLFLVRLNWIMQHLFWCVFVSDLLRLEDGEYEKEGGADGVGRHSQCCAVVWKVVRR